MSEVLISSEHVSKKFCRSLKRSLYYGVRDVIHSLNPWAEDSGASQGPLVEQGDLRHDEFWALQDISFEVRRGECLGLIGHNGAGKSTLLKILNGLVRPDAGRITMRGRVGALIELSAGFDPILTGRENIYTQAALLGFERKEVERKFDAIVDFSELEDFLDMPLQNYSSGMKVRLGFAVSSQMEPDILLIDEVLAVGDVGFRAKCLSRIGELLDRSAFIFVSHTMPQVARICTHIMHLDHGKQKLLTQDMNMGFKSYYDTFDTGNVIRAGDGGVDVVAVRASIRGATAEIGESLPVRFGDDIDFEIECEFKNAVSEATVQLMIWNQELVPVMDIVGENRQRVSIKPGHGRRCRVTTRLSDTHFNTGRYLLSVIVLSPCGLMTHCLLDRVLELNVSSNHGSACSLLLCTRWQHSDQPEKSLTSHELTK
jgi:lipopolysaccharide transport system ATP-binding protein